MKKGSPALVTQTKLDNNAVTNVEVDLKRTVTYLMDIKSAKSLSLPYAYSVDEVIPEEFKNKPKRVSGKNGKIVVINVRAGQKVALFLNSDAHPSYRKNPVYQVTPKDFDIVVKIEEKSGKHTDSDTPLKITGGSSSGDRVETYSAVLTGDIWMRVSHKYTLAEVDALLQPNTSAIVLAAVRRVYEGLTQASMKIEIPSGDSTANVKTILVTFDDGNNPVSNMSSAYNFLEDGLKRVHPAGYEAVFSAAIVAGVEKVAMTSAWRPMLGSIAHRAGLGLDINYVGATRMNRQKLRVNDSVNAGNVSPEEKRLFDTFESSKTRQSDAQKSVKDAEFAVQRVVGEPGKLIVAKQKLKDAIAARAAAEQSRKEAEIAWAQERDKNEPDHVRRFRSALLRSKNVAQVFDPWFMDSNTHDNLEGLPNMQKDDNEKLHSHHLHITVYEPKIL